MSAIANRHELEPGRSSLEALSPERETIVAISAGLLLRSARIDETESAQLFGPGELITSRRRDDALLAQRTSWTALTTVHLTAVDVAAAVSSPMWPQVARQIIDGLAQQAERTRELILISQLPRVEQRVLALMLHLAERHAKVLPGQLLLPIALTHRTIGTLIGARRSTVSLALGRLAECGALRRREDGQWLLATDAGDAMMSAPPSQPRSAPWLEHAHAAAQGEGVDREASRALGRAPRRREPRPDGRARSAR